MSLNRPVILTFGTKLLMLVLGTASGILLARSLGPQGRGEYAIVVLIPATLSALFSLGLAEAHIYCTAKAEHPPKAIVGNALVSAAVLGGVAVTLAVVLLRPIQKHFLPSMNLPLARVSLIGVPFTLLAGVAQAIYLGRNRVSTFNTLELCRSSLFLVSLLFLVGAFHLGLAGAVWAWLATALAMGVLFLTLLMRYAGGRVSPSLSLMSESLKFGVKNHGGVITSFLHYRIDMFLLSALAGDIEVGLYAIAVAVAELFWYLPSSIQLVLTSHVASRDPAEASRSTLAYSRNICFLMAVAFVIFLQFDRWLIRLAFGQAFAPASLPLRCLLPGIFSLSLSKILSADVIGRGKPEVTTLASLAALVTNVAMNLLLIPGFQAAGAGLASSISYTFQAVILIAWFLKTSQFRLTNLLLINLDDMAIYRRLLTSGIARMERVRQGLTGMRGR